MNNTYYTQVLDEPFYLGNDEFLSVITNGKVRHENEQSRDFNKDAGARAGLLRINAKTNETQFVDFHSLSEQGDRYRGVVVVDGYAYVMRTQKEKVDSIVRVAKINLETNEVTMIEEKGVTIHGTVTPKTFCGHFNFGRPIAVGTKIIYPPLNSGMIIEFDTVENKFIVHEIDEDFASIHSVYVPELNQVVFYPYGKPSNKLVILDFDSRVIKTAFADTASAFYHVNTANGKAVGAPLIMDSSDKFYFWIYDGKTIQSVEYVPESTDDLGGQMGFKYGTMQNNKLLTHTCWDGSRDLVTVDLDNCSLEIFKTGKPLGAKPVFKDEAVYLFPSITSPSTKDIPSTVFKYSEGTLEGAFELPSNNITSGAINDVDNVSILAPYEFNLSGNKLAAPLSVIDLESKSSKLIDIDLSLEEYA